QRLSYGQRRVAFSLYDMWQKSLKTKNLG
ncbi:hypothetical protein LPTSP4_36720, partial [Leptospira ryugenii]